MDIPTLIQSWPLSAIAAVIAGIVVLLVPRALNYAVALYLLFIGILGVLHHFYGGNIRLQAIIALIAGALVLLKPQILNYVVGVYLILVGLFEAGILRL